MENKPQVGAKPVEGPSGSFMSESGRLYEYDETGRIKRIVGTSGPLGDMTYGASTGDSSARIGDYVIQNGQPVAVPNSPTDLAQKYRVAVGGSGLTSEEAIAQSVSLSNIGGGAAAGAAIGYSLPLVGPLAGPIGAFAGALNAYNTAAQEAFENWKNEDIKYDVAVDFFRDEDGKLKYKIDYQKMGMGNPRSGEGVLEAQTRETNVALGDDGRLKVTVSPIFASTARFQEIMDWVSENYAGLTKDTENYEKIIEEIKNGIDGEAKDFITNMQLYADYANKFPNASPEGIVAAYMTEVAGYIDPEKMSDFSMTVIGDNGLEVKTAKEFFDSVYKLDKDGRNDFLAHLYDIIYGDNDYGDNEKAIAFGEMRALYAASKNPEGYENNKYQGMLDADFFITYVSSFSPLGLNVGDVLHFISGGNLVKSKQEFLNQNDLAKFMGIVSSIGAGYGLWKKGTSLIEKGLKRLPGSAQLFAASMESSEGGALAFWAKNRGNPEALLKASSASLAFKTLKVGTFDAALAGTKTLVSGTDFWKEFGQDFGRDMLLELVFSYYDMVMYEKAVESSIKGVYRDVDTGYIKIMPQLEDKVFVSSSKSGGTTEYELVGTINLQQTRAGDEVGFVRSQQGETYIYNGKAVTVSPSGEVQQKLISPGGTIDGWPVLNTGISTSGAKVTGTIETTDLRDVLTKMGLPSNAEIFSLPAQSAFAAQAAGKFARFDITKAGLAINTHLFNKNAALDVANEIALAKTGDLTAWQNRSQKFVSVLDNANQEKSLIKTGTYLPSARKAFEDYQMALGELNFAQRYSKQDADFLKASIQLERAAYLDNHRIEGDTRNYTAEALEKYGEAIAKVPEDRAAVLRDFNEKRKVRHDATKLSAKKSGKIDVEKLDSLMDSDLQKEIGWVPQWGKKQTYNGLLDKFYGISQERNIYKEWLPEGGWVDLDKLEDPMLADERFFSFVATNMGIADVIENAAAALEDADMLLDNTPTSETVRKRKLDSIKNKDELTKKFSDMIAEKKKEVNEKVMNQKQYKDWVLSLYKKYNIDGSTNDVFNRNAISARSWDKVWKNASPEVRKIIRSELEKTSLQTGYGIKNTRARLNAQVPGADVLDWSLLGRDHTNGLVPGGLYAGKASPVKAYIMSVDDLAKLAGYDLDNAIPNMGKVIEDNINTKGIVPMLPAHIRGSGDGPEIWLKMRWGHNSDGTANWTDYLKTLKERGIEKVPVAIDDARGSDFNSVFYQVRNSGIAQKGMDNMVAEIDRVIASGEKPNFDVRDISAALHLSGISRDRLRKRIRRSIPSSAEEGVSYITNGELDALFEEAEGYDWTNDAELNSLADNIENVVKAKIGYVPQDITADVQRAFSEYGQIPFFRGQSGLGQFNMNDLSSTSQVGDAYWIAPNASYTDEYGNDKIMGTIAVKYFMSDKEKSEIVKRLSEEENRLVDKATELGRKELLEKNKKVEANAPKEILSETGRLAEKQSIAWNFGLKLAESSSGKEIYIDNNRLMYELEGDILDSADENPSNWETKFTFRPLGKIWESPADVNRAYDRGKELLSKKDLKRLRELQKLVDVSGTVSSYRALAEYAKKPVIDISEDGFANGTAFFYYKGVSPEFDEKIGQQLAAQALFDRQNPHWTGDTIANAMENYDGISLDEMIDNVTNGEGFGEGWDDLFEQFNAGEISSSELSEEVSKFFKGVGKRYPGIGKVMQETWDNNTIQDLRDMKFKYWHPSTGYPTVDDNVAGQFLEDMGERPPRTGEPVPEGQTSMWDTISPISFASVPTEPQFKQPSRVTYNDYSMGIQADPNTRNRVRDAIKASQIENLIRNVTSLLYEAAEYNKDFGYTFDTKSYLNTSLIPDLNNSISNRDKSLVAAVVNKSVLDVAPYRSRSEVLKSAQESVAEEWREWAEKHIKAGRASSKELKKFAEDNDLKLPDDKRPLPSKIKHALGEMLESGKKLPRIEGLDTSKIAKGTPKEEFYKMLDETPLFQSATKDKKELVDLVAAKINGETTDAYEMGAATTALGLGGKLPITWYRKGKPYTRFITYRNKEEQRLAEAITELFTDKQLVKQPGIISRVASLLANDFRLLTTGLDPTRAPLNFARDTGRSQITSGGQSFINPNKIFQSLLVLGDYTPQEREKLSKALDNVADMVAGETYNAAYRSGRRTTTQATKEYLSKTGASPLRRFTYNLVHDKRSIVEFPGDFAEGLTRKRLAKSAATVKLRQLQLEGADFDEQLKGMVDAAFFAGREYTANFARKGKLIGEVSRYVAYLSSSYAGFDGIKRAFINNPQGVSKNFAVFLIIYLVLLADTLGNEKTRKNYYRLSEYDRGNSIVISLDDDTILTIPLDQEIAGFLFPYRRFVETLNGVDPVSFFEFMWGTFTEPLPMDLSGFSEGGSFNLVRGIQKLTSQHMPNIATGIQETSTGYDLYYGSDISVTDETLKDYGIYAPEAGDYTTAGKDSLTLRAVSNATGIPQWQLQNIVENYGGNVGSYVLNVLDKLQGATEKEQGGKDFVDSIFKSFVATDQNAAESAFYDGIKLLQQEKNKLIQKIADYNEDIKTATGDAKVDLQVKLQKAKDDYAVRVADFVDQYVSAYEITGGLSKNQAMQVYYLFRLDDDDTVYESGSVAEYYKNKATQQFKKQATAMSAPILDKYYNNRIGNVYQDADGVWRRYLSSGTQAMRNSIYGQGEEHMVNLLNILEGKDSSLKDLRTKIKKAREVAYNAKDWDTRDALGYELDKQVIAAISPYIEQYGAENVLGEGEVLDYLSDWFIVPDDFIRSKKGKYVSLGHNASTQEAFVRPYIKYVFGLPTNYYSYSDTALTSPSLDKMGE